MLVYLSPHLFHPSSFILYPFHVEAPLVSRRTLLVSTILVAVGVLAGLAVTRVVGWWSSGEPTARAMPAVPDPKKPNVVFVLMDNLGYGELGCYGGGVLRGAPTPRIDKLAAEGTRLLNFNVEAQCTPSRSAFMTGRF